MNVTILTDASWDPERNVAGYGYWIASDRGKRPGGAPLKGAIYSSNHAEMAAVVNALYIGLQTELVVPCDKVLFQLDNQHAIGVFTGSIVTRIGKELEILEHFGKLVNDADLIFEFRHVKGHTGGADARSKANQHCDARARTAMRQARQNHHRT